MPEKPAQTVHDAFDEAMRRLVRVPKKELDAEEAKYKAMRKRLKDKKRNRKREH